MLSTIKYKWIITFLCLISFTSLMVGCERIEIDASDYIVNESDDRESDDRESDDRESDDRESDKNVFNDSVFNGIERDFKYKDSLLCIAYSGLNHSYPMNSLLHFEAAIEYGFHSLKTDLQLTKDSQLVLCHDEGYTFDNNGRIISFDPENCTLIHDLSFEDVLSLEFRIFYTEIRGYEHPASFDDYLALCKKNNLIPFITIRQNYVEETLSSMFSLLSKYDFLEDAILNIFPSTISTCKSIRSSYKTPICYTLYEGEVLSDEIINLVDMMGNAAICINYSSLESVTLEQIKYLKEHGIGLLTWFVSNEEQYHYALSRGCMGFQVTRKEVASLSTD